MLEYAQKYPSRTLHFGGKKKCDAGNITKCGPFTELSKLVI
jgi:hypothetical protein